MAANKHFVESQIFWSDGGVSWAACSWTLLFSNANKTMKITQRIRSRTRTAVRAIIIILFVFFLEDIFSNLTSSSSNSDVASFFMSRSGKKIKTKREIKKEITRINCSALSNPALLELGFQKSRKGLGRVRLSGNHRLYITLNESWEVKNGGEFCWLSYSSLFLAHLRAEFLWDLSVIDFHSRGKSFSCRLLHCYNPRHYISREIS